MTWWACSSRVATRQHSIRKVTQSQPYFWLQSRKLFDGGRESAMQFRATAVFSMTCEHDQTVTNTQLCGNQLGSFSTGNVSWCYLLLFCYLNVSWFSCSICIHVKSMHFFHWVVPSDQPWLHQVAPEVIGHEEPYLGLRRAYFHSLSSCRKLENDGKWWNMPLISREWQGMIQNGLVWTDIPGLLRGIWPTSSCLCEYCNQRWPVVKPCRRSCHVSTLLKRTRRTLPCINPRFVSPDHVGHSLLTLLLFYLLSLSLSASLSTYNMSIW